jgi:ferritin
MKADLTQRFLQEIQKNKMETPSKKELFMEQEGEEDVEKVSGEPKLYKLSDKVVKFLNDRIKDEYYAHYLYRAAANWCHDMNYKKAAAFFDADANAELEHAQGIQKYMADFNILPTFIKTEQNHKFDDLIDIIYKAYEFELYLMKAYNKDSASVLTEDLTTFDFLQKYREIQKESVIEFNDLINASNLINKNNKFEVLYFENTYF